MGRDGGSERVIYGMIHFGLDPMVISRYIFIWYLGLIGTSNGIQRFTRYVSQLAPASESRKNPIGPQRKFRKYHKNNIVDILAAVK